MILQAVGITHLTSERLRIGSNWRRLTGARPAAIFWRMQTGHHHPRRLAQLGWAALLIAWALVAAWDAQADSTRRRIRVPILMYHYISVPPPDADRYRLDLSVTPEHFAEQLAWLRDHDFTAITLDDLYAALTEGERLPDRPIILTFDDGYADAYEQAFPLLDQYEMVGTFFVVTDWLDEERAGYLTWEQAREMAEAGMSIQDHSRTHADLANNCDHDCLVYQILGSAQTIEVEIGQRPRFFCYPSGRYNDMAQDVLAQVGMLAAVTTEGGTLHVSDRPLELRRVRIRGTTRITEFAWLVSDWRE
ncbi:MAG: polysaccharide deacetylase family protein [Anaerolineae bacterium]|nr:polysaccharide deacetylase family protein [Anaerolineae bacterium]